MASYDIPVHLGSAAHSRCRHDGDDRGPAGSFSSSNTAGSPAKLASRGRHDERSVSESPPGYGIERDEDDGEVAIARRFPTEPDDVSSGAKTSGNITRLTDHANGNFRSHTGDMAGVSGNDSQAVSAMALLLLAASPPSQSRCPAASGPAGDGEFGQDHGFSPLSYFPEEFLLRRLVCVRALNRCSNYHPTFSNDGKAGRFGGQAMRVLPVAYSRLLPISRLLPDFSVSAKDRDQTIVWKSRIVHNDTKGCAPQLCSFRMHRMKASSVGECPHPSSLNTTCEIRAQSSILHFLA